MKSLRVAVVCVFLLYSLPANGGSLTSSGMLNELLKTKGENGEVQKKVKILERMNDEVLLKEVLASPKTGLEIHVLFDTGSALIQKSSLKELNELGIALNNEKLSGYNLTIRGHTDSQGKDQMNLELSFKRAESVKRYLVKNHHLSEKRIMVQGFGENLPVASNSTPKDRQKNRRVEIIAVKEKKRGNNTDHIKEKREKTLFEKQPPLNKEISVQDLF
ncbi:MAG: OmpA family protein [Nitrospinae bacterium]|nr:OmpA family protein [Nitrospinota bacterium]